MLCPSWTLLPKAYHGFRATSPFILRPARLAVAQTVVCEFEETDVAWRVVGPRQEHRCLAELLDSVADEVHDVVPQGKGILVARWGSVEVLIGE